MPERDGPEQRTLSVEQTTNTEHASEQASIRVYTFASSDRRITPRDQHTTIPSASQQTLARGNYDNRQSRSRAPRRTDIAAERLRIDLNPRVINKHNEEDQTHSRAATKSANRKLPKGNHSILQQKRTPTRQPQTWWRRKLSLRSISYDTTQNASDPEDDQHDSAPSGAQPYQSPKPRETCNCPGRRTPGGRVALAAGGRQHCSPRF